MPCRLRNLSVLAYANGFSLWHYKAGANLAAVTAPGFFNDAVATLCDDDMIMVTASNGARILSVVDADIDRGTVTLAPLT